MKKTLLTLALLATMMGGQAFAAKKPTTVIHVINVRFKPEASKEDVTKAIAAIGTVAGKYKGIKNVWLNPIKVQGGDSKFTHVLVMEFASQAALKKYTDSPEQLEWYKLWLPVRELSNTHDVTN
ncbi:Dabb family protein [Bryobacter aggregatus]|uniref:Dabb family protein n=1 Tax=Bryobacter aggregatus TaxID=360054 RepID=UPI0004E14343|nr:Dabb family protein [Bryobacter aggregatus]